MAQIRLKILPSVRCLFDKLLQVKVEGLAPHKQVELRSRLVDDKGVIFKASALYQADEKGLVDVSSTPSLGGSYTGVEPMGLWWSMVPDTPHKKLVKKTVLSPTLVEIAVHNRGTGEKIASEINEREYMTEGMRRIPVQEGRVRGVLFIPPGKGPFPGILDLYTLGGGLNEQRASLLANKGFVVLALAYYGYQDLPKNPKNLDLEYFEEAASFLQKHPEVRGPGIGVISMSHSGALALSMASFFSGITATVCINGCSGNTVIPLHYKDSVMPPLRPVLWKTRIGRSWLIDIRDVTPDPTLKKNQASLIPIERANCHFLFAASEDDRNWNSAFFARQAADILKSHGKESFQVVSYPKAGHFLEVPHMPFCPSSFHAAVGRAVAFGGEPKAHSEAQLDLWERVQEFFKRHCNCCNFTNLVAHHKNVFRDACSSLVANRIATWLQRFVAGSVRCETKPNNGFRSPKVQTKCENKRIRRQKNAPTKCKQKSVVTRS